MKSLYAVYDKKVSVFGNLIPALNDQDATRAVRTAVNDPSKQNPIAVYPEDYDLYFIGQYDEMVGKLMQDEMPRHVTSAIALKAVTS